MLARHVVAASDRGDRRGKRSKLLGTRKYITGLKWKR
jgi:hypothetical protein